MIFTAFQNKIRAKNEYLETSTWSAPKVFGEDCDCIGEECVSSSSWAPDATHSVTPSVNVVPSTSTSNAPVSRSSAPLIAAVLPPVVVVLVAIVVVSLVILLCFSYCRKRKIKIALKVTYYVWSCC